MFLFFQFSFGISPSNKHPGLISFRMDLLALVAIQGTLKSLLQHHSSKASIIRCSAFFKVQLSHPYMTTGKTIALTRQTFVGKVMSLLFNMLSRLIIAWDNGLRQIQLEKWGVVWRELWWGGLSQIQPKEWKCGAQPWCWPNCWEHENPVRPARNVWKDYKF